MFNEANSFWTLRMFLLDIRTYPHQWAVLCCEQDKKKQKNKINHKTSVNRESKRNVSENEIESEFGLCCCLSVWGSVLVCMCRIKQCHIEKSTDYYCYCASEWEKHGIFYLCCCCHCMSHLSSSNRSSRSSTTNKIY